jgi:hypothetical protein
VLRRVLPVLLVCGGLLAGCGSDAPPRVTFTVGGQAHTAAPTQWCDLELTDCTGDAAAQVHLAVPAGTPVQIGVPDDVASAPWHVVFSYRGPDGRQVDARSPVFAPGAQHDYALVLPEGSDQLLTAQVQQFGPAPTTDPQTGEIQFPVRGSWVLVTDA